MGEWDGRSALIPRLVSKYELGLSLFHDIFEANKRRKAISSLYSVLRDKRIYGLGLENLSLPKRCVQ